MVGRDSERFEIVLIPLDFGAFCDLEAHAGEGRKHITQGLGYGMQAPPREWSSRKSHVKSIALYDVAETFLLEGLFFRLEGLFQASLRGVSLRTTAATVIEVSDRREAAQDLRETALASEELDVPGV
jgi:hypothetical protein